MVKRSIKEYSPRKIESKIRNYWKSKGVERKLLHVDKNKQYFSLFDKPILVKHDLGLKSIYRKLLYDTILRYKRMQGYSIWCPFGYNPFNIYIEKKVLKENFDDDIFNIQNFEDFFLKCRKLSDEAKKDLEKNWSRLGTLYDKNQSYSTDDESFIESIWWSLAQMFDEDIIDKKSKVVDWCTACQIPLTEDDIAITKSEIVQHIIKFPVKKGKGRYILVNTKQPWKILSNTNIVVDPTAKYSVIVVDTGKKKEKYILLKRNVEEVLKNKGIKEYKEINVIDGEKLEGIPYEHPLLNRIPYQQGLHGKNIHTILLSDKVRKESTGMILFSPGLERDILGFKKKYGLVDYSPINEKGIVKDDSDYEGYDIKDVSTLIIDDLKEKNNLFSSEQYEDEIQICDHCGEDKIARVSEEWFFDSSKLKKKIVESLNDVEWNPESVKSSIVESWTEDLDEWCITRRKGWGIPLPIWKCNRCGNYFVVSTTEDLPQRKKINKIIELFEQMHDFKIECPDCKEEMIREEKVLNHLFISSCSIWAQLGYVGDYGIDKQYPVDLFMAELAKGSGLMFATLTSSLAIFDTPSMKEFLGIGMSLSDFSYDKIGKNIGLDSLRIKLLSEKPYYEERDYLDHDFERDENIPSVLWNLFDFYCDTIEKTDIELEDITYESVKDYFDPEDIWLKSRLESTKLAVKKHMDEYNFDKALMELEKFIIDDIAQFYIGLIKGRLIKDKDKIAILKVLQKSLIDVSRILAPFTPHLSEEIYQTLSGKKISVFIDRWPHVNRLHIESKLEREMEEVKDIIEIILQAKRKEDIPLKWTLKRIVCDLEDKELTNFIHRYSHIIKKKAHVKYIEVIDPDDEWEEMDLVVEANRDAIGQAYRQWVSKIALLLERRNPKEIKKGIENGEYTLGIEGHIIDIQPNMVNFSWVVPEGYHTIPMDSMDIYVDLEVTEEIWNQQIIHEFLLRVNLMREELDLKEEDEIDIFVYASDDIIDALQGERITILKKVNGREINFVEEEIKRVEYLVTWDINGEPVDIGLNPFYRTDVVTFFQKIPGVDKEKAKTLYKEGYTSIELLKESSIKEISHVSGFTKKLSKNIVEYLKEMKDKEEKKQELDKETLLKKYQEVKGIGTSIAQRLYDNGFDSLQKIIDADVEELTNVKMVTEEMVTELKKLAEKVKKDL
ncbi:MAG: class I tRNA ligase family protein [Thermoplasmatota archaeon]